MSSVTGTRRPQAASSSIGRPRITASSSRTITVTSSSLSFSSTSEPSSSSIYTTSSASSASATDRALTSSVANTSSESFGTCLVASDCAKDKTCSDGRCVNVIAAPTLGGLGSEPTSRLSKASAAGLGVGLIALIALMFGLGFCFLKMRRRPRKPAAALFAKHSESYPAYPQTPGALTPDKPQHMVFPNTMAPVFFANAPSHNDFSKEKFLHPSMGSGQRVDSVTAKDLPSPPLPIQNPLPSLPIESRRYSVSVNTNKRVVLEDEKTNTLGPVHSSIPLHAHASQYKFQEYRSPMAKPRPISIKPAANKRVSGNELRKQSYAQELDRRTSGLELAPYPEKPSVKPMTTAEDELEDEHSSSDDEETPRVSNEPPQLSLPQLRPPSTGFNFDSTDWYQYITGTAASTTPSSPGSTPSQSHPSQPLSPTRTKSKAKAEASSPLIPAPLTPKASTLHLFPLPSPSSAKFRLSQHTLAPPTPTSPPARLSVLSTMTRATRNSRSWVPESGLYLPDENGANDAFKRFKKPDNATLPATTYSPLT